MNTTEQLLCCERLRAGCNDCDDVCRTTSLGPFRCPSSGRRRGRPATAPAAGGRRLLAAQAAAAAAVVQRRVQRDGRHLAAGARDGRVAKHNVEQQRVDLRAR